MVIACVLLSASTFLLYWRFAVGTATWAAEGRARSGYGFGAGFPSSLSSSSRAKEASDAFNRSMISASPFVFIVMIPITFKNSSYRVESG